jgi:hypothetical protein
MLLDSNIIIYAAQPEHADLRTFIAEQAPEVSAVSVVEVLGRWVPDLRLNNPFTPTPEADAPNQAE